MARKKSIDYDEVKRLYNSGLLDGEIAEKMNCAMVTVYKWRESCELPSNRQKKKIIDYDEVKRLYDMGLLDGEIAKKMNCSKFPVLRWRKSRGLPLNTPKYRRVR